MPYTKRNVVYGAYEELNLAGYEFNLTPEEMEFGLHRLDDMMASWDGQTVSLGYNTPLNPDDSDLDDLCGTPDWARLAMKLNLAVQLAAAFGKQLSPSTLSNAKIAFDRMLAGRAIPQMQLPQNLPTGAGNQRWGLWRKFFQPTDPLTQQNGPEII